MIDTPPTPHHFPTPKPNHVPDVLFKVNATVLGAAVVETENQVPALPQRLYATMD